MIEQLNQEEILNCIQLISSEDRQNQEVGFAIFTGFEFDDFEIMMLMLDNWKGFELDTEKNGNNPIDRRHYFKNCLGQKIYMTFEPKRLSIHYSFGNYIKLEGRIWLNNFKQRDIDRFTQIATDFIKRAKQDFK